MAKEKVEPKKEEQRPESTPKVRWWNKLKDGVGNAIGEWFSNR